VDSISSSSSVAMAKINAHDKIEERKITLETYTKGLADVEDQIKKTKKKMMELTNACLFREKKVATAMLKFIVPWSIAIHCLFFAESMKLENIKEMIIAIINEQQLMSGHPDFTAEAKKHSVTYGDFAKQVKNAAGMNHVVWCTYI
jgi:predicted nucleic-acid-binding protein